MGIPKKDPVIDVGSAPQSQPNLDPEIEFWRASPIELSQLLEKHRALAGAVCAMGLDPEKLTAFYMENNSGVAHASILLQHVRLDEQAMRSSGLKNIDAWITIFDDLKA